MNPSSSSMVRTVTTIVVVVGFLILLSIIFSGTLIADISTVLFFSGLVVAIGAYGLDNLFFGHYQFKGRGGYKYSSSSQERTELNHYLAEEGGIKSVELDKARSRSSLLLNISLAGVIAIILSFVLSRFS